MSTTWQERHNDWKKDMQDAKTLKIAEEILRLLWQNKKDASLDEIVHFLGVHAFDADYVC